MANDSGTVLHEVNRLSDVDIIHIGYHKTGSTWLQRFVFPNLQGIDPAYQDPLMMAVVKHLISSSDDDFQVHTVRQAIEDRRLKHGRLLLSSEGLSGSLWKGGQDGPRTARRLATVAPNAKIIVLVREQGAMLRSIYAQYVNEGGTVSLGRFLAGGTGFQIDHLHYARLTGLYRELFGPEHVLILPYEVLRTNRQHALAQVSEHVDAEIAQPPDIKVNPSLSRPSLAFLRWWNRNFRTSKFNTSARLSVPSASYMRQLLQQRIDPLVNERFRQPSRQDRARVEQVLFKFHQSNRQLQPYIGYDLQRLGYPMT